MGAIFLRFGRKPKPHALGFISTFDLFNKIITITKVVLTVVLQDNGIHRKEVLVLKDALQKNKSLKVLKMNRCERCGEYTDFCEELGAAIGANTSLEAFSCKVTTFIKLHGHLFVYCHSLFPVIIMRGWICRIGA